MRSKAIDAALAPSLLIADAVKRSPIAHLFHFYPSFCDIAAIPRKTPSSWITSEVNGHGETASIQVDARSLAKKALRLIGEEMGMGSR
jgi:hypothetical protein